MRYETTSENRLKEMKTAAVEKLSSGGATVTDANDLREINTALDAIASVRKHPDMPWSRP